MKDNAREGLLKTAAIVCLALLVGDRLVLTPLLGLWQAREARIEELEKNVGKGTLLLDREKALSDRWAQMQQSVLPKDMPTAENQVLKSVDRWVQTSGIVLLTLKPQWRTSDEGEAAWLECRAGGQGTMESIARFLYEMEQDSLPLKVEEVEITAQDETGKLLSLTVRFTGLQSVEKKSS